MYFLLFIKGDDGKRENVKKNICRSMKSVIMNNYIALQTLLSYKKTSLIEELSKKNILKADFFMGEKCFEVRLFVLTHGFYLKFVILDKSLHNSPRREIF